MAHSTDDSIGSRYFHDVRIHRGTPFVVTNKDIMVTSLLDTVLQSFFYYLTMEPTLCRFASTRFDSTNSKHNISSHKWSQNNIKPLLLLTHNHRDDVVVSVVLKATTREPVPSRNVKTRRRRMQRCWQGITLKTMKTIIDRLWNDVRPPPYPVHHAMEDNFRCSWSWNHRVLKIQMPYHRDSSRNFGTRRNTIRRWDVLVPSEATHHDTAYCYWSHWDQ